MTKDDIARAFGKKLDEALFAAITGPQQKQPQTALRLRGNGFETVELDDAGRVIEPVRCTCTCTCGCYAVIHHPKCPFAYITI